MTNGTKIEAPQATAGGGWRSMDDAPKDGRWILGFCGDGKGAPVYTAMRWWDGIMPDDDDDLSTEEVGEWVGPEDRAHHRVTHWMDFQPHPDAPPPTPSFDDYDGANGIRHPSRAERGITQDEINEARAAYEEFEAVQEAKLVRLDAEAVLDPKDEGYTAVEGKSA